MAKRRALTDDELLSAVDAAEQEALGPTQSDITSDRADAVDRYLGKPYGDEQKGRSQVVSRDVSDTVEGVTANVVKPFISGDRIVQFDARGPEDEEQAEQETNYANFIALERNNGFIWLTAGVKDALLLRNGYLRCGWKKREDVMIETYEQLSDDEMAIIGQDMDVEIVQHSEYPGPLMLPDMAGQAPGTAPQAPGLAVPQAPPSPMLHDVKVRRKKPTEYVEIKPLPPDYILVSERHDEPSLQEADFVQYRPMVTISYLREQGYDIEDDITDDDNSDGIEQAARQRFGTTGSPDEDATSDPARRLVRFKESYIRIDRDGDGIAELRRVCQVGKVLLADEETEIIPFACFTGVLMPHQHLGASIYDQIVDLARLKTALLRSFMDNKYLSNNGRTAANVNTVNIDDLLVSRPGGVVRVDGDPNAAIVPIITPDTGASALQGLEYLDTIRENRTGYTRQTQGLSSDALSTETLGGQMLQLTQSQLRLEMIARTIAETGLRDTFAIVHALTLKHSTRPEKIRLQNKWVTVNPREWVRRADLSIAVGLGSGTAEQRFAKLMALAPLQQQAGAMGLAGPMEFFNLGEEIWKEAGYKNPERFIHGPAIDPQTGQPQMPPPPPSPQEKVEQLRQQGAQQALQAQMQFDGQAKQMDHGLEQQKIQMEAAAKQQEQQNALQIQAQNDARDDMRAEREHARSLQEMELEYKFKYDEMAMKFQFETQQKELDRQSQERTAMHTNETTARGKEEGNKHVAGLAQTIKQAMRTPRKVVRGQDGRVSGVVPDDGSSTIQ